MQEPALASNLHSQHSSKRVNGSRFSEEYDKEKGATGWAASAEEENREGGARTAGLRTLYLALELHHGEKPDQSSDAAH